VTWDNLPFKVKALIIGITLIALPIFIWSTWVLFADPPPLSWLILVALALGTVPFFLALPSVNTYVGIGDSYVMAVAMLYGPTPCIIASVCHTLIALFCRRGVPPYKVLFNTSSMICGAWLYSNVYRFLNPTLSSNLEFLVPASAALTITFFLYNSLIISTAISWTTNDRIFTFWSKNYLPLYIDFSVSAVSATAIVAFKSVNSYVPFAVAPLVGVVWGWNKVNKAKAMEQEQLYLRTVETLALAVDAKDQTTYGHIRRVKAYALALARLAGIVDPKVLKAIETGALLHDIGKLAVEDYILNKPGRLNKQEFEKMKVHSTAGDEILQQVQFPYPVAEYVRYHHERWDGNGYPDGLKGEAIPIGARILSIADAFDAIRSTRPYKTAFGTDDSVELLRVQSGTSYDPKLIELFISNIEQLELAADEASKNISELSFRKYYQKADNIIQSADVPVQEPNVHESELLISIFEFCTSTASSLQLSDALPIIGRYIRSLVPYTICSFYVNHENSFLKSLCTCPPNLVDFCRISIPIGKGISGWVVAYNQPMLNANPAQDLQDIPGNFSYLKDAISVPLSSDGICLGTITLYSDQPRFYTQSHLSLLQLVAEQVSPLICEETTPLKPSLPATRDSISGAYRANYLSVIGSRAITQACKAGSTLSLIAIDLKNYNQNLSLYGSAFAEIILRKAADLLRAELRQTDILARFGHHGFIAILPGVKHPQASRYVQRLQQQLRNTHINLPFGSVFISCQFGISTYPADGLTLLSLLQAAQTALTESSKVSNPSFTSSDGNIVEFPPRN